MQLPLQRKKIRKKKVNNTTHILCLETATTNCSVALSINGKATVLKEDNSLQYSHAESLHTYIEAVLNQVGIDKQQLNAIAVSKGPGSYTGLRIGVSAAKGLCYALDIPLLAIPTLEALAVQAQATSGIVIPMIDARRMEVYSAIYDRAGKQLRETQAQVLDENAFARYLEQGTTHFIGNGVAKFAAICNHKNAVFLDDKLPSAREMAVLAQARFEQAAFEDLAYFEPYYLKDFILGGKPK